MPCRTSPTATLATPTVIRCDRCRSARRQAVMARVRHVADRYAQWICPECRTVWAFVSAPKAEFLVKSPNVSALRPSVSHVRLVDRWRSPAKWARGARHARGCGSAQRGAARDSRLVLRPRDDGW